MSSKKVAKDIVQSSLIDIKPITDNQKIVFGQKRLGLLQ